jgi:hypothetical protein
MPVRVLTAHNPTSIKTSVSTNPSFLPHLQDMRIEKLFQWPKSYFYKAIVTFSDCKILRRS